MLALVHTTGAGQGRGGVGATKMAGYIPPLFRARVVGQLQLLSLLRVCVSDYLLLVGMGGTRSSWGVAWVPGDLQECVVTQDGRRLWCRQGG